MPVVRNEILVSSCRPQNWLFKCQTVPGLRHVSFKLRWRAKPGFGFGLDIFFFFLNLP